MGDISKAELQAMIDVQSKTAQQLERIANSLTNLTESQKDINASLPLFIGYKDTLDKVNDTLDILKDNLGICGTIKKKVDEVRDNIFWIKIILGSLGLITGVAIVILKLIEQHYHG